MKRILLWFMAPLFLMSILMSTTASAQVNVTFVANVATAPDTLQPTSIVQIRGSKAPLTWDNLTGGVMTNVGGDYWMVTLQFAAGDTVLFKFNLNNSAWEQNLTDVDGLGGGNRSLIVGATDTTLPVEYFNNGTSGAPQYFRPWSAVPDSFMNVYFRVNMQGVIEQGSFNFNNDTDTLAVRGGGPAGSDLDWGTSFYLTRENYATNGGFSYNATYFWSGRLRFPKSQLTAGQSIQYKFLIGYTWGRDELQGNPNRQFTVPVGLQDTTLKWVWYNNQEPIIRVNQDTVIVTYLADLTTAISNGGFSIGDTLVVRSGYFGTAAEQGREKQLHRLGLSNNYTVTDTVVTTVNGTLDYQYYLLKNAVAYREVYYNFAYIGGITAEAERRQVRVGGMTFSIFDTAASISKARRQPNFQNTAHLAQPLTVTFTLDARPAILQVQHGTILKDRQGTIDVSNPDSVLSMGVFMNGPATDTNYTWQSWGSVLRNDTTRKMYDDGTHGDVTAGDSIFTRTYTYTTNATVGQEFKFGIGGGDNEGGYGNNHIQNLDDSQPASTLFSQYGSIDPISYFAWNYDCDCPADLRSTLSITPGWNMLALPRRVSDPRKVMLFPTAMGNAFMYSGSGYVVKDSLLKGVGYWLKFPGAASVEVPGDPILADSIPVIEGWNMVGSITMPQVPPIKTIPDTMRLGVFFGYAGGYFLADTLLEGHAYWIKTDGAGKLVLNALSGFGKRPARTNDLASFDRLTIRDASGASQTLYLGVMSDGVSMSKYQMPPLPPSGVFDARFASNRIAEAVEIGKTAEYPLSISSASYPLTVSWELKSGSASLIVGSKNVPMRGTGSQRVYDPQARISVNFSGSPSLPKEFALSQNYPNPFNPTTRFNVDVPMTSNVEIAVYDLLGQKIVSLMTGQQSAGSYEVVWDGRDARGLSVPTGIYFVHMSADKFTAVRKIMLMK